MELFPVKLKELRMRARYSIKEFSAGMNVSRNTVSAWENGRTLPSEKKVREMAKILNIPVNEISDLKTENNLSGSDLSNAFNSWTKIGKMNHDAIENKSTMLIDVLVKVKEDIVNSNVISRSLLSALSSTVYIKDINLKYLAVNFSFLDYLSLDRELSVFGKKDINFFPIKEAKENEDEDRKVLLTGEKIVHQERYLPGSRKKNYCLASKLPITDDSGKIIGVMGEFIDITERRKNEKLRVSLQYVLNKSNIYIWAGRGITYDEKGYPFTRNLVFRLGGAMNKYYGGEELTDILTTLSKDEMVFIRNQVPESLKRDLAEKLECGPYPIERRYKLTSPFTKVTFNVVDYIYYMKEDDILVGVIIPLSDKEKTEDVSSTELLNSKLQGIENKLRMAGVSEKIISESLYQK